MLPAATSGAPANGASAEDSISCTVAASESSSTGQVRYRACCCLASLSRTTSGRPISPEPHLRDEQVRRLPIQLRSGTREIRPHHDIVAGNGGKDSFGDVVGRSDNKDPIRKVRHGGRSISNAYAELALRENPLKFLRTRLGRVAKDDTMADKHYIPRTKSWPVRARDAREEVCLQADFFEGVAVAAYAAAYAVRCFSARSSPSSATAISRILNFCTLPVTVVGNSSTNFQ